MTQHHTTPFNKALLQFILGRDPFLAMLNGVMTEKTRIEAEARVGATKGKNKRVARHAFPGRGLVGSIARMGMVYLLVSKVR